MNRVWPGLAKLGPMFTNFGRSSARICPTPVESLEMCGTVGQIRAQNTDTCGHDRPNAATWQPQGSGASTPQLTASARRPCHAPTAWSSQFCAFPPADPGRSGGLFRAARERCDAPHTRPIADPEFGETLGKKLPIGSCRWETSAGLQEQPGEFSASSRMLGRSCETRWKMPMP